MIASSDAGQTWALVGKVPASITVGGEPEGAGVTDIRAVDADTAWAFGPKLFQTTNGGASWTKATIPGGGRQVLSLAASSAGAYARGGVPLHVRKRSVQASAEPLADDVADRQRLAEVNVDLPASLAADVSAYASSVYVIDELADGVTPDRLYASTDGVTFAARPVPCNNAQDVGLIQAVPTSAADVAMLCDAPIGFGQGFKKVYRSSSTGESYRFGRRDGHGRHPGVARRVTRWTPGRRVVRLRIVHLRQPPRPHLDDAGRLRRWWGRMERHRVHDEQDGVGRLRPRRLFPRTRAALRHSQRWPDLGPVPHHRLTQRSG